MVCSFEEHADRQQLPGGHSEYALHVKQKEMLLFYWMLQYQPQPVQCTNHFRKTIFPSYSLQPSQYAIHLALQHRIFHLTQTMTTEFASLKHIVVDPL